MMQTLSFILIHPLMNLMERILNLFHSITGSYGGSILLLSVAVNTMAAPFFSLADLWQKEEQDILKRMGKRLEEIKAVFKGDERHFYIKTTYRHHGYSPFMSIRSSFGLLIQIPFFMAAYSFLSHYSPLEGQAFLFLRDLSQPDRMLGGVNFLPFLMTAINLIAARRFSKDQTLRSRFQLYGMALLFLLLLYGSASGLLLYWTCNNLYAMGRIFLKNSRIIPALQRLPQGARRWRTRLALPFWGMAGLFSFCLLLAGVLFAGNLYLLDSFAFARIILKLAYTYMGLMASLYFLERYKNTFPYQVIALFLLGFWFFVGRDLPNPLNNRGFPYFYLGFTLLIFSAMVLPFLSWANRQIEFRKLLDDRVAGALFKKSLASLFLMAVAVIPLLLINNSPGEILLEPSSFKDMVLWALFYLILLPFFLYRAHPGEYRKPLSLLFFCLLLGCLLNFLVFTGQYGFIDDKLQFSSSIEDAKLIQFLNLFVIGGLSLVGVFLVVIRRARWLNSVANLVVLLLISLSVYTFVDYRRAHKIYTGNVAQEEEIHPEIPFSREAPNTVILMMDRALGGAVPSALEAFPELKQEYDGFTWYKNTISYGNSTVIGLPALLGGYDYSPRKMLERPGVSAIHKMMESWTVLPEIFLNLGHTVYIADPSNHNLAPDYDGVALEEMDVTLSSLEGRYTEYWMKENTPLFLDQRALFQRGKSFFMFSLFRMAPSFLRETIYNRGMWHSGSTDPSILRQTGNWNNFKRLLNSWSTMEYLGDLSFIQEKPAFNFIYSMVPHEVAAIDADFAISAAKIAYPQQDVERYGSEITVKHIYTNVAVLKKLTTWFEWMKSNGIYDNTQIIIVADHGRTGVNNPLIPLDNQREKDIPYNSFQPLLMFKPFNAVGELRTDDQFMTNGDVPSLILESFGEFKNPYTQNLISQEYKGERQIVGIGPHQHEFHKGETYKLERQYSVSGNTLDPRSWERVPEDEMLRD